MVAQDLGLRLYGSGWDDMEDYLGEDEGYHTAASRRERVRVEEEKWQRAVDQVTVQVGGARREFTSSTIVDTSMVERRGGQVMEQSRGSFERYPSGRKWRKRLEALADEVWGRAPPSHSVGRLGWLNGVGRRAMQGAALEMQLKVEQAKREALEEAFATIGVDLPDLEGLV